MKSILKSFEIIGGIASIISMVIAYFQWQKDEEWFAVLAIFICILFLSLICYQRKFEKNKTIEIDKKGKFDTLSDDIFISNSHYGI